jgi:hypothetical protein
MVAHDVSRELRGYHGRWSTSGVVKRLATEAAKGKQTDEARAAASLEEVHKRVQEVVNLPEGKGKGVNGFMVRNMGSKGLRVTMPGSTAHYKDPREAAVAAFRKEHHQEGHSPIPLPGTVTAPGSPRPEPSPPSAPRPARMTSREISDSLYRDVVGRPNRVTNVNSIPVFYRPEGTFDITIKGKTMRYHSITDATLAIFNEDHHQFGTLIPGSREERALRELAAPKAGEVAHPKSLEVKVQATAEDKKRMRQQVIKATTHQAQVTPDLVAKTDVTVTKAPHGKRKTPTLASHSGQMNTLHVKPEVLTGNNAQAVLDYQKKSEWWVPTDQHHDLSMNVLTHEFGHGIHGEINKRGIMMANRHNPNAFGKPEQEFWQGFAKVAGLTEPMIQEDQYGRRHINVPNWLGSAQNYDAIASAVSRYGARNMNEMVAEMWTEYRLSSAPRPAAKYFGDYVTRRLKEE